MLFDGGDIAIFALPRLVVRLIAPRSDDPQKLETYEPGVPAIGRAWSQFHVRYYGAGARPRGALERV